MKSPIQTGLPTRCTNRLSLSTVLRSIIREQSSRYQCSHKTGHVSPDGRTYTFNLRQVNFSNGDPFNAYQVWGEMYGFYYLAFNASSWMLSYNVFNMSPVRFGPATIALMNQSGLINPNSQLMSIMENQSWPIYVTGPHTIVFHLQNTVPVLRESVSCIHGSSLRHPVGAAARRLWNSDSDQHLL